MPDLLTSLDAWAALVSLTALEIVLGIDNVVFISIVVARLDARRGENARRLGLALALVFRIALLSMLALPLIIVLGRRGDFADLGSLAATVVFALLINAAVCGALSNPHNRYGARLVWVATFAVALVPMRYAVTRPWKTAAAQA